MKESYEAGYQFLLSKDENNHYIPFWKIDGESLIDDPGFKRYCFKKLFEEDCSFHINFLKDNKYSYGVLYRIHSVFGSFLDLKIIIDQTWIEEEKNGDKEAWDYNEEVFIHDFVYRSTERSNRTFKREIRYNNYDDEFSIPEPWTTFSYYGCVKSTIHYIRYAFDKIWEVKVKKLSNSGILKTEEEDED